MQQTARIDPELGRQVFGYWFGPGEGESALLALSDFLEINFSEERWASEVRTKPGLLADDRDVAFFALRLVDSLGRSQADHWGVRLRGVKRR